MNPKQIAVQNDILHKIRNERVRQDIKWGYPRPDLSNAEWLTILTEEVGEVAKEVLEVRFESHTTKALTEEIIQIVAVGVAWLEHLEEG